MDQETRRTNKIGLAGFLLVIIGLVITLAGGGCVGVPMFLLGWAVSLIGLLKSPRSFACAGSSIGCVLCCLVPIGVVLAVLGGLMMWDKVVDKAGPELANPVRGGLIVFKIEEFEREKGKLPATLAELDPPLSEWESSDFWGNPFVYEVLPGGETYSLRSAGEDKTLDNEDDFVVNGN